MPTCIYCLQDSDINNFNKEHVIPKSFGGFKNNLTLIGKVCKKCNGYFGRTIELYLGRDSFEGMLRYRYGIKKPEEFKLYPNDRLVFSMGEEGSWKGAIVKYSPTKDHPEGMVNFVSQVGFKRKNSEEWEFFEAGNIKTKSELEKVELVTSGKRSLKILYYSNSVKEKIYAELKDKGINLRPEEDEELLCNYSGKNSLINIQGIIDIFSYRVMAKIAFNYLAYHEGAEFALSDNFDAIRRFIRYGEETKHSSVILDKQAILFYDELFSVKQTRGHLLTLNWNPNESGPHSKVSLFNKIAFRVTFCERYLGIYRKIRIGHHFNIESRAVEKLSNPYL